MKRITLIALLILCSFVVAQGRGLVLQLTGGVKAFYPLTGNDAAVTLKMTYEGLQVEASQYAFSQIEKFYISETDEEVSEIKSVSTRQADIFQQGGMLFVTGGEGPLHVYGIDGKDVSLSGRPVVQTVGSTAAVNLQLLPSGIYVLQTGKKKVKLMKR